MKKRRTKGLTLPIYKKRLFVIRQTLRNIDGEPFDVRYAEDTDTAIPFLYPRTKLDPGQLDDGMEDYVEVEVTIRPLKPALLAPALPMCFLGKKRREGP